MDIVYSVYIDQLHSLQFPCMVSQPIPLKHILLKEHLDSHHCTTYPIEVNQLAFEIT